MHAGHNVPESLFLPILWHGGLTRPSIWREIPSLVSAVSVSAMSSGSWKVLKVGTPGHGSDVFVGNDVLDGGKEI